MQAHADRDQREAETIVGVVVAEHVVHREGADRRQADRHGERKARDRRHREADRARERLTALGHLKAGKVRQQRSLDRLKQL